VAGYTIAASVLPHLVLIAAGHLAGQVPAAAGHGLSSAAGLASLIQADGFVRRAAGLQARAYR
jgi:hypothetical protein